MTRQARDEAGAALVMAMVMGAALVIVLAAVFSRGLSQAGNAADDRCWETALDQAESALNWGLARIDEDPSFHSGVDGLEALVGTADERLAVVAAADAATDLVSSSDGDGVFLRSPEAMTVHAVGYCAGRDQPDRRVRVIRAALGVSGESTVELAFGFLSVGDLEISGTPTFEGAGASVHANSRVAVSGNVGFGGGCLTSSGGGQVNGRITFDSVCPPPSQQFSQPEVIVPQVSPRDLWPLSEYDLCPDRSVRAGPAHPTHGATVGGVPCSGQVLAANASSTAYRNWSWSGSGGTGGSVWRYGGNGSFHGSYFVYQGSAVVAGSPGSGVDPWRVSLAAEGVGACPDLAGGDITVSGSPVLAPYRDADGDDAVAAGNGFVAGRDLVWSGNGAVQGSFLFVSGEQTRLVGTVTVSGAFVARSACHTAGSPVAVSQIGGNPTVRLDSPILVVTEGGSGPITGLVEWTEVR